MAEARPPPLLSAAAIWRVADLLRGGMEPAEYGPVILVFTMLRRLELSRARPARWLDAVARAPDPLACLDRLTNRLPGVVRDIISQLEVMPLARRLARADLLGGLAAHFTALDLSPARHGTEAMARLFEELVHHFADTRRTGAHFTPPEVTDLMVDLVFAPDGPGARHNLYDPAAGTGALLGRAADRLRQRGITVDLFGQEISHRACALCRADMLLRGRAPGQIVCGDTLAHDGHAGRRFARMLSNPPFGLDWRHIRAAIQAEHAQGHAGRFAPGLPRVADGSMLFMLHLVAHMRSPRAGGARIGVVTHGAALTGGSADSGESAIRRYLVEHDLIDAVIALPADMFVNTGIATYVWILDNNRPAARRGTVRLVDATGLWQRALSGGGEKRREMTSYHIDAVLRACTVDAAMDVLLRDGADGAPVAWQVLAHDAPTPDGAADMRRTPFSCLLPGREFLYRSLMVTRPGRDGAPVRTAFRVGMEHDPQAWFSQMIRPYDPDARLDTTRTATGCAISFARYFHHPVPLRPLQEIEADLRRSMARLVALMPGGEPTADP
ncbi:type I restriction-modification system subunit M [Komagataeibacter intermedius]|uniref:site-specific DNA-methyltransferase (adenine-specific) n=3 Tax=Komagataeibacter intermedius TaxID=66229 RepID=A0A0N0MEM7_9PROT|nr:class I SAM-dependent DNA methyltransferase [Komagataeibacter intermedius]KPH86626.1 type I restriction endonuclease EcoprrI subunit M [Komagataeibacter intermedius AF2]MCF3635462.1 type I restriction-modification system subunit M [Komagataeibacter intermedius]GAN86916.1 type I DNA methyltransferase M subunit [Komagataeibacter intermedius TF2]GBQ78557.1 type I DNA methyltransferase M subunit [Komagataeibacter intermedius NRIC 0521]